MAREMVVNPSKCIGCSTCALTCSITHHDEFRLQNAHVRINKKDFSGIFEICFASTCLGCKKCAGACPTGALKIIRTEDPTTEKPV
ncbi:MAG: 4Fe-4S binding protein [Bacillota bacterium]